MTDSKAESIEMAASVATSTKTLKPTDIEVTSTSGTNDDQPQLLSPKSWRERRDAYQPPSRRQTNGTIDAEDYFVWFTKSVKVRRVLTEADGTSGHVEALQMAVLHANARLRVAQDDSTSGRCYCVGDRHYMHQPTSAPARS